MSIYATWLTIEDERQWVSDLQADGIKAGVIRDGSPDFDDTDAPIIYQGSNILPSDDHARGGAVEVASIPSHITRDMEDSAPEDGAPHPWLRLGVHAKPGGRHEEGGDATVVLTKHQATRLRDTLTEWLDATEAGSDA